MTGSVEPPHVGTVLGGRYELVRHIARGGMGDVYEARDQLLQRPSAVKLYRAGSAAERGRFEDEVRVLARLNHPGLVQVYDAGEHGDDAYVVMELIDGDPLRCTDAGCPSDEVADIAAQLAAALAYVHAEGIVHRDVTPSNILREASGRVRLVDFGIVRKLEQPGVTSPSITLGTPAFMAPEQVRGSSVSTAADVYSLGLVLLELLTGRREFSGTVEETAIARLARDPDTELGVPPSWRPLLRAMLQRDPEARPTAAEVVRRIPGGAGADANTAALAVSDLATAAVPSVGATTAVPAVGATAGRPTRVARPRERTGGPRFVALFATALVAAVLALILVSGLGDRQPLAPPADAGTSTSSSSTTTADRGPAAGAGTSTEGVESADDVTSTTEAPVVDAPPADRSVTPTTAPPPRRPTTTTTPTTASPVVTTTTAAPTPTTASATTSTPATPAAAPAT